MERGQVEVVGLKSNNGRGTKRFDNERIAKTARKEEIEAAKRVSIATRLLTFIAVRKGTVLISSDVEQGSR